MSDNATPTPSSADHDAAMAAKFDQNNAPKNPPADDNTPPAERPSWLPEGFNTPEEFAADYAKLKEAAPAPTPDPANATAEDAAKIAADAGLDYTALSAKFDQTGSLEDSDYAALEAKGIPRSMVDAFIDGQMAIANQFESSVMETVGGKDSFDKITGWAASALPKADVEAFNRQIDAAVASGDLAGAKLALAGLKARWNDANGEAPNLIGGEGGGGEGEVFSSTAQLTAAMRDPRYAKDPAYRREVEAKLSRSKIM